MGPGFHIVFIIVYPAFQKLVFLLILAHSGAKKADHITFCRSGEPEQLLFLIVLRRIQKSQKRLLPPVFPETYRCKNSRKQYNGAKNNGRGQCQKGLYVGKPKHQDKGTVHAEKQQKPGHILPAYFPDIMHHYFPQESADSPHRGRV